MGERNRRIVILMFLVALPALAVIGPRFPRIQHARRVVPEGTRATRGPDEQAANSPSAVVDQEAWLGPLRRQLQDLGAVYVRLERWNGTCPVYQFRCDLRLGPRSGDQTSIEAFSGSAEAAAQYVLLAARQWSHQQSPPAGALRLLPATGPSSARPRIRLDRRTSPFPSPRGVDGAPKPGSTRGQPLN